MSLNKKIISGVFWNGLQTLIQQGFSFVVKLLLARLLFPEDYGLIGMAVVFTSFVQVFNDLGMGAALIQRKEENLNQEHYHTAFWTSIIWALLLFLLILFIVTPLAASFYEEPVLSEIIPVLSIGILFNPVNVVHKAQLTKAMNFKKMTFINNTTSICAGIIALIMAFNGYGVWSLVFNSIIPPFLAMPLFFLATKWKPKFIWSGRAFKDIFGFGAFTTGTALFNNLISKLDYLLIGKLLSASALGIYTFAFLLTDIFRSQLMGIMTRVMYPVYGNQQKDLNSLKNYYLKVVKFNSILVYPVMTVLLLTGPAVIEFVFGDKWIEASLPLRILSVSVMFHMMVSSNTSLIRGMGRPGLELKLQSVKALVFYVPLIFVGTYYYGIVGAAVAVLINKVISVLIAQYYLKKLVNISIKDLMAALWVPIVATLMAVTLYLFAEIFGFELHFIFTILVIIIIFCVTYWKLMPDELQQVLGLMKHLKNKKNDQKSHKQE